MKSRRFIILNLWLCIFLCFTAPSNAHSGRTDANGGHWNRKTGEYHYHNGGGGGGGSYSSKQRYALTVERNAFYYVRVLSVLTGDTIKVSFADGYEPELVRLIGCDAPALQTKNKPADYYGVESTKYTTQQLKGKKIWLQTAPENLKDENDRFIGYIWLAKPQKGDEAEVKSQLFNAQLLVNGCAKISTKYPAIEKYAKFFTAYEADAKSAKRGLWKQRK